MTDTQADTASLRTSQVFGHRKSSGIAHEAKSNFHFTVSGPGIFLNE
jgi:hypothetical protein